MSVWTTPELIKAVEMGYRLLEAYEVWHYPRSSSDLFRDYVQRNLKLRQEASGYPSWCKTEEDRARYLADYEAHEWIVLDPDHIEKNPGMRMMAKLRLNSLWGKFGQNPIPTRTECVEDPKRFYELVFGEAQEVTNVLFFHDEVVQVQYHPKKEFLTDSPFMNVVLASFVTSYARLKLYGLLSQLGERVLYFDTDSVIYVTHPVKTSYKTSCL